MELREDELNKRLKVWRCRGSIRRGIGDDGAVIDMEAGEYVFVQDGLVEHCHFDLSFVDILYVGKKAVYVNVSDCLSMGAIPRYFLVTIGIPKRFNYRALKRLYGGIMPLQWSLASL